MALEEDGVVDCPINNSVKSHNTESQCNPEEHPKRKRKKKKLRDRDALVDLHVDTSTQDDSIGKNSCTTEFKAVLLPALSRNNNSIKSHNINSPSNPEAESPKPKKKKRKRKLTDKDASIDIIGEAFLLRDDSIGTKLCHDSLVTIDTETDSNTAALPVLPLNWKNNSLESHNIDSQCNPHSQPKMKKEKRRLKDKDSSVELHVDTSTQEGSVGKNPCQTEFKTVLLPALSRNTDGLESQKIDSPSNPEAECPQPKKKKRKRKLTDKDASVDNNGEAFTLKDDSIGTKLCHDSLVTIDTETDSNTAALSVLPVSGNNNTLESHNIDSQCNPCSPPKKKKEKRKLKDKNASVDLHADTSTQEGSVGKNPCQTESKTILLPVLSRNTDGLESQKIDSPSNPEAECPKPGDSLVDILGDTLTQKDDSIEKNPCHNSLAKIDARTEFKTAAFPVLSRNNSSLETHNTDVHRNPKAECPRPKKKKRKKKLDIHGDTSMPKDDSIGTYSCHDSLPEINAHTEFKTAAVLESSLNKNNNSLESHNIDFQCKPESECPQPKKKKKRKMKDKDASVDLQVDNYLLKDDLIEANSCRDSLVEINATTEFKTAAVPVSSKNNNSLESHNIDSQFNPEARCPQPTEKKRERKLKDKDASIYSHVDTSKLKDDSVLINSCHDSLVEINAQAELETAALPELSRSKKKGMRKKEKLNPAGIIDKAHVSVADMDLTSTEENALISGKQSDTPESPSASIGNKHNGDAAPSVVETEKKKKNRVKKKKQKQKPDSSENYDNAPHPHADVDVVGMNRGGLLSEKQVDPRSPSVNMLGKHDSNEESACNLDGNENVQKKRKRDKKLNTPLISDKAHVPPAELHRSDQKDALINVNEIGYQSTSGNNESAAHILVGKENTKTSHIEANLRSRSRKGKSSSNSKEEMQLMTVARQVSSDTDELHSTKTLNDEVEGVQAGKVAVSIDVVGNVLADKTSVENHNLHQLATPLVGAHVGYADKKLLILDVNGLLVDVDQRCDPKYKPDIVVSKKYVFKRPFCDEFLQFCFEKFNVGVWSSRLKTNLDAIINFLMADSRHKLLFCWDQSHCTNTGFTTAKYTKKPLFLKELKKLWDKSEPGLPWNKGEYNESNTLLLDDSPCKALRNPANTAIFPQSYNHRKAADSSLGPGGDLRVYLEKLADAPNVQEYVANNPFGKKAITIITKYYQRVLESVMKKESRLRLASSAEPAYAGKS